jgi:GMP synthase-like glutamine amidotransferase
MQSHCGQIEWPPKGWELVATGGPGTYTKTQCIRLANRSIYAAQFHIEMEGTPLVSQTIMGNFLALAKAWWADRAGKQAGPQPD